MAEALAILNEAEFRDWWLTKSRHGMTPTEAWQSALTSSGNHVISTRASSAVRDGTLEEIANTAHDYIFGPPGPHVSADEYEAWRDAMFEKLEKLLQDWMKAKSSPPAHGETREEGKLLPKTVEFYETMARMCERDGKPITAAIWQSNADQLKAAPPSLPAQETVTVTDAEVDAFGHALWNGEPFRPWDILKTLTWPHIGPKETFAEHVRKALEAALRARNEGKT